MVDEAEADGAPEDAAPVTRRAPEGWTPGTVDQRAVSVAVTPTTYDADARTVQAVIATGARVRRWFGWEELAISDGAINLERVARGQCRLLDHHNQWQRSNVLGFVTEAHIEDGALVATLRFADNGVGRAAEADVASGLLRGVSVGYRISRLVLSEINKDDDDVYRAEDWELLEVSLVSVPADPYAGVRTVDSGVRATPGPAGNNGEHVVDRDDQNAPADGPEVETRGAEATAGGANAMPELAPGERNAAPEREIQRRERERVRDLRTIARQAGMDDAALDAAIDDGTSPDAFRRRALEGLAERSAQTTGVNVRGEPAPRVVGGRDETETRRRGMADAIAARMARAAGVSDAAIPDHARRWGERDLAEIAAECIGYRGLLRTGRQVTEVFERAFHSTSDFPAIFIDAMNTRLLARYQTAAPTYRRFCARYTVSDFRATNVIRAGDFPALQSINEAGEIKSGTFSESKEQLQVTAHGVMLQITRPMIVNDQLGAIDQVLGSAGVRVADWENTIAFGKLTESSGTGPVLATDGKRMFHADHGNKAATGTAIDVTSVGKARAAMMKQTTLDGLVANFQPRILLCGPDKQTEAEQLLATITPATIANAVPASFRSLDPVADANMSGNAWYLFADPMIAPCLHYGYLEGFEGPRLSSEETFSVQGLRVKLEHDFGVAGTDYRGGYFNSGA